MAEHTHSYDWISQFKVVLESRLNKRLSADEVYQLMEDWFQTCPAPLETEESPIQNALTCLSGEVLFNMPYELRQLFDFRTADNEDSLLQWINAILNLGRSFQEALDMGKFDVL